MRRTLIAAALGLILTVAPAADAAKLGSRPLRIGSHGADVVQLQRALHDLGYAIAADGAYGKKTAGAVRSFERTHHLKVDGVVDGSEGRQILRLAAAATKKPPATGGQQPPDSVPPPNLPPVAPPPDSAPPPSASHVFPILGPYSYGTAANRFGAPRGTHTHQGQDVLAALGTPLVSVSKGTVIHRSYQASGAGNYVVIRAPDDGFDYVYMHMVATALVTPGDHVTAGQLIGHVGNTGESSAPHLHFEIWSGRWYDGGKPIDPLPYLKSWL